jgi:hypothetical protein
MKLLTHLMNPIGIIAMFAALCEASATTVLPHLDEDSRQIYIWFLIAFPSVLVVLFFLTLNFNHHVLYAPDYQQKEPAEGRKTSNPAENPAQ